MVALHMDSPNRNVQCTWRFVHKAVLAIVLYTVVHWIGMNALYIVYTALHVNGTHFTSVDMIPVYSAKPTQVYRE